MDDMLKYRISEALGREPSPARAEVARRDSWTLAAGIGVALAAFLLVGGFREWGAPRSPGLIAVTVSGSLVTAGLALRATKRRGALPASREALLGVLPAAPFMFFAWKAGWSVALGEAEWWPTRPGLLCLGVSLVLGGALLTALIQTRRRSDPLHPRLGGAGLGVASGAAAAVLTDLWCPVGHPAHVAIGHVLPMLLLGLIGAWAGGRALAMRTTRQGVAVQRR